MEKFSKQTWNSFDEFQDSLHQFGFDITTDMLGPNSKVWLSNFQISYPMY